MAESLLEKYPENKRLYATEAKEYGWIDNSCIFGMAHHNDPFPSINTIPPGTSACYSFFGEGSYEVVKELIDNRVNEHLQHLTLGLEHSNAKYGYKDYSKISELLSTAKFPNLKSFEYGIDYLLVNEEQYYPHLGDLTEVLNNMPAIEKLYINGTFELKNKTSLKTVKECVIMDAYAENINGVISRETLDFLMESELDSLETLCIALEINTDCVYHFNEKVLLKNIHKLKCVEVDGKFENGTQETLSKILKGKANRLFLDGIIET